MKPHELDPIVESAATEAGVDPQVFKALVRQESSMRPGVVHPKSGAVGLAQLLPSTAADVAKRMGLKNYDLKDPATNALLGATYLKEKLDAFNGDIELALTAYHSGEARVERLLRQANGSTLADILPLMEKQPAGAAYARSVLQRLG